MPLEYVPTAHALIRMRIHSDQRNRCPFSELIYSEEYIDQQKEHWSDCEDANTALDFQCRIRPEKLFPIEQVQI